MMDDASFQPHLESWVAAGEVCGHQRSLPYRACITASKPAESRAAYASEGLGNGNSGHCPRAEPSAASCVQVSTTVSGLSDIESMPCSTSQAARSG